ncbi:MAG: hypothetical protein WCD35_10265 [Mycobacteriales bacterium]
MAEETVLLEGGSRDGETTVVDEGVRRLLAASEAPGLIDVYEADGRTARVDGADALVFVHVGQQSAEGLAPEMLHPPLHRGPDPAG